MSIHIDKLKVYIGVFYINLTSFFLYVLMFRLGLDLYNLSYTSVQRSRVETWVLGVRVSVLVSVC